MIAEVLRRTERPAVLFPGQGSPPRDMREQVERDMPELAALLYEEVGTDVFDEPEGSQRRLQSALFASIVCGWKRLSEIVGGPAGWGDSVEQPEAFAGHSLGEVAALVAAEAIDLEQAVQLVHLRGEVMERALAGPARGAMAALIGPEAHRLAERLTTDRELWLANDNSAVQVVVSGTEPEVDAAIDEATAAGLRVVKMPMKGAGHSPLMEACLSEYAQALQRVDFRTPRVPVYSGATARPFTNPRRELFESLTRTVRFREILLDLRDRGVRWFIDTGPGHTMAGLAHKTLSDVVTVTVQDLEESLGIPGSAPDRVGPTRAECVTWRVS